MRAVVSHTVVGGPTHRVKSTLIASSRAGLFEKGHRDAYERALGQDASRRLQEAAMGNQWLDLELAALHYRAADAVGLSVAEMHKVGNVVGSRIEGSLMGSLARLARAGGLTNPWIPLGRLDQLWFRMYEGGSIAVFELGPKDARIEIEGNALADIPYWRIALTGLVHGAGLVFANTMHTTLVEKDRKPRSAVYQMSWV